MGSASWITTIAGNFISPTATKLRTTITTLKVASMVKIDFYVTGYNIIFISGGIFNSFKVHSGPGLA
jgi:hypothetical protein